jgi:hypothetical protein
MDLRKKKHQTRVKKTKYLNKFVLAAQAASAKSASDQPKSDST